MAGAPYHAPERKVGLKDVKTNCVGLQSEWLVTETLDLHRAVIDRDVCQVAFPSECALHCVAGRFSGRGPCPHMLCSPALRRLGGLVQAHEDGLIGYHKRYEVAVEMQGEVPADE